MWFRKSDNEKSNSSTEDDMVPPLENGRRKTPSGKFYDNEMMGPLMRRKKVVSFPLEDPFFGPAPIQEGKPFEDNPKSVTSQGRTRQKSQSSMVSGILRRKQVSLDLMSPYAPDFFEVAGTEEDVLSVEDEMPNMIFPLRFAPRIGGNRQKNEKSGDVESHAPPILKATKKDKIKAVVLFCLMTVFLGVCVGWKTHSSDVHSFFGIMGTACVTECKGDPETRNFFIGHEDRFNDGDVIEVTIHIDPYPRGDDTEILDGVLVEIAQLESGSTSGDQRSVKTITFGGPDEHYRKKYRDKLKVDWENPDKRHVLNVTSKSGNNLSFTLAATRQTPLSNNSILIAALIMVVVYIFILLELIHRTLVSIYGSMVALFFYFIMHNGETESIKTIMLHQEWSTLGLLFGMMIIVGELSHTGIFEWLAVRILVSSKGSFNRLIVLLCLLTAVASAFLDNVTTMLLLAPVTIDMCGILGVDPRPYLISEVILSNVGGTATLIGDPPNIIIGSSFSEYLGFLDFIINIMPCIILFAVPVSLALMVWIYKPYLSLKKMTELDAEKLKTTYPVYDEPRLLIAGTTTFFVILLFFLHPVHHKDTAWLALVGAFLTISFTNPHDVQDVLRNHVEWDTLLFFAGLFVLVEVCAAMGLLEAIGGLLASIIKNQEEDKQLPIAITLILWVSGFASAFLDNIPYTATMIPVVKILSEELPETLPIKTLAWALSFGACLGGNGTLLGASANIVTAGIATNKGYQINFMNFFYPGMFAMIVTIAIANLYMIVVFVWI